MALADQGHNVTVDLENSKTLKYVQYIHTLNKGTRKYICVITLKVTHRTNSSLIL